MTVLPVAVLAGLVEHVLARRGGRTAPAIVATAAGALGCLIAVPLVVGSILDLASFRASGEAGHEAEDFVLVAFSLAAASVVRVAAAVHALEGRSRLLPIVVLVGALEVVWGPRLLLAPAA